MSDSLNRSLALVNRLKVQASQLTGEVVEQHVWEILRSVGYAAARQQGAPDEGIDMQFQGALEGRTERVGVHVSVQKGPVSGQTVYRWLDRTRTGRFDRIMLITKDGGTKLALDRAGSDRFGRVDLLSFDDLGHWVQRHQASEEPAVTRFQAQIRQALRDLALHIAEVPEAMFEAEWREMELLLGEVFRAIGFQADVTPSSQDGGYDIRLTDQTGAVFLVEVKHWTSPVGKGPVKKLVTISARERAAGGLILGSSGFAPTIFDGRIEVGETPIHAGGRSKIQHLCRCFYRTQSQLWLPENTLQETLFADTRRIEAVNHAT